MNKEKDFCLEDYWEYFKDLNNQNNLLGVESFEDALREVVRILRKKTTKRIMLNFDKKPCKVGEDFVYCGGCKSFVIEEGCTCNMIDIGDIDGILGNKFALSKETEVKRNA